MNSLEALAVAARDGAHIVHVPSGQAEADLAAGHLGAAARRLRAGASSISPDVSAVAAGFAEDGPSPTIWPSAVAASIRSAPTDEQNHYSILKPCQMTVVYQAADQARFVAS
jgi:hypothetical protein